MLAVNGHTALARFAEAMRSGTKLTHGAQGLCGRIIRGREAADFLTLTDDPDRKLVMLIGADGLAALPGKSGYDMLVAIGYTAEHIERKVVHEGNRFKLVVFPEGGPAKLATWENTLEILGEVYPKVRAKLHLHLDGLRSFPFAAIERTAGFRFAEADKAGKTDPRFMTYERLCAAQGALWEVRAFLYHTVHLRELFAGDGYTYTQAGSRGLLEYMVPNRPITELGDHVIIDIDIQISNTGGTTMPRKAHPSYQLPLPAFFDPKKVGEWRWIVDYKSRFNDALAFAKKHGIKAAALDRLRIALMPIDCQLTFCHPDFELYVGGKSGTGAIDDTARLCEFLYRNLGVITRLYPTMDTHMAYQIFHPAFLVNRNGEHPDPRFPTQITRESIQAGEWVVDPKVAFAATGDGGTYAALQAHLLHYAESLASGGKYALTIWPFHAMLMGQGHALVPALEEAIFFHTIARGSQAEVQIKGGNTLTENYSVLRPEVLTGPNGNPIAQKNAKFIKALLDNDMVIIAGQAKSHCVAWTIQDLLDEIMAQDPALVKKVYLLEDCTSPVVVPNVVDFSAQADEAFAKFAQAGMHIVSSTTPIGDWQDVDASKL